LLVTMLNCSIHCSGELHLGFSESTSHHKTTKPKVCVYKSNLLFLFFQSSLMPLKLW
jgi:hypothetical protein